MSRSMTQMPSWLALVGLDGISNTHLPVWKELDDCELVAVCDTRPEQMDAYPDARHYTDFYEMLEKEKLDMLLLDALHGSIGSNQASLWKLPSPGMRDRLRPLSQTTPS